MLLQGDGGLATFSQERKVPRVVQLQTLAVVHLASCWGYTLLSTHEPETDTATHRTGHMVVQVPGTLRLSSTIRYNEQNCKSTLHAEQGFSKVEGVKKVSQSCRMKVIEKHFH